MSANKPEKAAASSKPVAAPAAPQAAGNKVAKAEKSELEADGTLSEDITASEVEAVLGLRSEGKKSKGESDEDSESESAEQSAEKEVESEEGKPAGESDEEAKPEGEGEAEQSGDVEETPEAKAEREAAEAEAAAVEAEAKLKEAEKGEKEPAEKTGLQKRIDELTARSKEAEDRLAKANERLAAIEAEQSGRYDPGVLEHIDSAEELAKHRQQIIALRQKLLRNPNGLTLPDPNDKTKTVEYDQAGVADMLAQTETLVLDAIPARERFLIERQKFDAAAVDAYPWMKDTRQGAGAQVQQVIEKNPTLRRLGPNYRLIAADALIGQMVREHGIQVTPQLLERLAKEVTAKKAPASVAAAQPRRIPPPAPSRAGVIPPRQSNKAQQNAGAVKRVQQGDGNANDLADMIAAGL